MQLLYRWMSIQQLPVLQPMCCGHDTPVMAPAAAAELAGVFKALGDPTRVAIVNRLAAAPEVCVCDLTASFKLSQPTISHHLRLLREAGLVESERRGTWAYYRLVPDAIAQLRTVFDGVSEPALGRPPATQTRSRRPQRRARPLLRTTIGSSTTGSIRRRPRRPCRRDDAEPGRDDRDDDRRVEALQRVCGRAARAPVGAVHGGGDREHERAAELERRVQQAAGEALLLGCDAARAGHVQRAEGEREADARPGGTSAACRAGSSSRARSAGRAGSRRPTETMPGQDQPRDAEAHDQRRHARRERARRSGRRGRSRARSRAPTSRAAAAGRASR